MGQQIFNEGMRNFKSYIFQCFISNLKNCFLAGEVHRLPIESRGQSSHRPAGLHLHLSPLIHQAAAHAQSSHGKNNWRIFSHKYCGFVNRLKKRDCSFTQKFKYNFFFLLNFVCVKTNISILKFCGKILVTLEKDFP